ncbi:MAG TPA: biotin--[acetyl-CoA-carboxylase] ligase [Candidatus Cryptobacteroides excrementigallinarum]|nr:biotin--[acetyl-CoA-carboxylase] ligase [Candidatus Cryptobacteroides excrementigallinarum]
MEPLQAGSGIIWVESTESTNSELRRRIGELDNLSVIAAREQTAGRGQGDHSWFSSPATNLTFSILFRFGEGFPVTLGSSDAVLVTQITTLAIRDHLLSRGIGSRIKWPNDIWTGDRKICGILIENSSMGGMVSSSIVGIGLNVNETGWPAGLPNPVSMRELSGKVYNLDEELRALAGRLRSRYEEAASPEGRRRLDEKFSLNVFRLPSKP